MSPIEILDNLISRLNNLFTVQTQEVIPELNKIKELLEQKPQEKPVDIVYEKEIEAVEPTKPYKEWVDNLINEDWMVVWYTEPVEAIKDDVNTKTIEELRKEYTEKFQKKPFAWWSKEVLLSKIQ